MNKIYALPLLAALIYSCSPRVGTMIAAPRPTIEPDAPVAVLDVADPMPDQALFIGMFEIGDTGFAVNCDYGTVVELAKRQARASGGNVIKLTGHIPPSPFGSSCHRIVGSIAYVDDPTNLRYTRTEPAPQPGGEALSPAAQHLMRQMTLPRLRFSFDAAHSRRTARTAPGLDAAASEMVSRLRNGITLGVGAHYFPKHYLGIGLLAENTRSSYSEMSLTDRINVLYVGPSFRFHGLDRRGCNAWMVGLSAGYYNYIEKAGSHFASASFSRGGAAFMTEVGYDIRLGGGNRFFALRLSTFDASFKVVDKSVSASGKNEFESLNAVRIGVGLRF